MPWSSPTRTLRDEGEQGVKALAQLDRSSRAGHLELMRDAGPTGAVPGETTPLGPILAMIAAMAFFVVSDTAIKWIGSGLPTGQIMVLRGVIAVGLSVALARHMGVLGQWRRLGAPLILLRSGLEGLVAVAFLTALPLLPLADITAILLTSPLLITAGSALLLKEQVGWRRWSAVAVGFLGMVLVVQPGADGLSPAAILALLCAVLVAARDLLTRRMPSTLPSPLLAVGAAAGTFAMGALLSAAQSWQPVGPAFAAALVLAGVAVAAGNYAIILAFRRGDVSVVSPYRYTVLAFSVLAGYLVFGDVPSVAAWAGIVLILGSGLYTLYRERLRRPLATGLSKP